MALDNPVWQDVGTVGEFDQRIALDPTKKSFYGEISLSRLTGKFAKGAWIELRGCNVAEGKIGESLLKRVATLLRVDVAGSCGLQTNVGDPVEWENQVKFATPAGTVTRVLVPRKMNNQGIVNY